MQEEKLVLPKFTVPGQRNWVKWALVGVSGLVVLNVIVFAVVVMNRSGAKATAVAPVQAQAPRPLAAVPPATTQAPVVAAAATSTVTEAPAAQAPAKKASSRRARHGRSLAKASSGGRTRTASSSSGGKSDAIDELLKRAFK
jgi:hypothetical protein